MIGLQSAKVRKYRKSCFLLVSSWEVAWMGILSRLSLFVTCIYWPHSISVHNEFFSLFPLFSPLLISYTGVFYTGVYTCSYEAGGWDDDGCGNNGVLPTRGGWLSWQHCVGILYVDRKECNVHVMYCTLWDAWKLALTLMSCAITTRPLIHARAFVRCAVISATSHLGDSQVGDKPTRRHESVNSATTYFLPFIIYFYGYKISAHPLRYICGTTVS